MNRCWTALALFLFAACGPKSTSPKGSAEPSPTNDDITMDRIHLYLHDTRPTQGAPRKPAFAVQAESVALADQGVQSFQNARAVIHSADRQTEDILIDAGCGRIEEAKSAYLEGGVVARIGSMRLDLEDLEWLNQQRLARTDRPVRIVDGSSRFRAAGMRLDMDAGELILTNGTGLFCFERNTS
ncbi:MAG TPA: hypothetical protein ENN80_07385 [Candidatus Hydrogenedentes bacterium]|nr:hypothetical protein [Candidatus Hydrogenedentota bacterium]